MTEPTELELKQMYEAYDAGYKLFLENWQINRQLTIDLMQQYLKPHPPQVAVLSLGGGLAEFDIQVIHSLKQQLAKELTLRYVAVEANPLEQQRYQQQINISEFAEVQFKVYPDKIADFHTDEKFDIIHLTHSMYHIPTHEHRVIQEALETLKDDGFVMLTLNTSDAVIYKTISQYAAFTGQPLTEMLYMEKMQTIVEEMGLSYDLAYYSEYIDIRLCFDDNSSIGKTLMDFLCQGDSHQLSPEQRTEILQILVSQSTEQDERKWVSIPAAIMIIPKQKVNNQ